MPHPLTDALTSLAGRLADVGIRAAIDPRDLNPPCALITVDRIDASLGGCHTVDAVVLLIAPDVGMPAALDVLADMLDKASRIPGIATATPDTVTLPTAGAPLPALRITSPTLI